MTAEDNMSRAAIRPTFKERYGYSLWLPWSFVLLVLTGTGSIIAVFYTMNIRWFLVTLAVVAAIWLFTRR